VPDASEVAPDGGDDRGDGLAEGSADVLDTSVVDDVLDAGVVDVLDAAPVCDFGVIVTNVFGALVQWNGGAPLPPGRYRVTYVDGCMKYSSGQGWSVNAYANGPDGFLIRSGSSTLGPAPGTVGFLPGQGGFATFDGCVDANLANDAPFQFDFAGGSLGAILIDDPYSDNVEGSNGRNPTYRLSSCP
jgi:hypothetical protein